MNYRCNKNHLIKTIKWNILGVDLSILGTGLITLVQTVFLLYRIEHEIMIVSVNLQTQSWVLISVQIELSTQILNISLRIN